MKKTMIVAMVILMAALFGLFSCTKPDPEPEVCGGRTVHADEAAPKSIHSTELQMFSCNFSPESSLGFDVPGRYFFKAQLAEDGMVTASYEFQEHNSDFVVIPFDFLADPFFMQKIDAVVKSSDILSHNGLSEATSGIAPGYGCDVAARYASGEYISLHSNSSNYIDLATCGKLIDLFYNASGAPAYYDTTDAQNIYYSVYQRDMLSFYAHLWVLPSGQAKYRISEKYDGTWVRSKDEGELSAESLQQLAAVFDQAELGSANEYPRREDERYLTMKVKRGLNYEACQSHTAITDEQLAVLEGMRQLILDACGE